MVRRRDQGCYHGCGSAAEVSCRPTANSNFNTHFTAKLLYTFRNGEFLTPNTFSHLMSMKILVRFWLKYKQWTYLVWSPTNCESYTAKNPLAKSILIEKRLQNCPQRCTVTCKVITECIDASFRYLPSFLTCTCCVFTLMQVTWGHIWYLLEFTLNWSIDSTNHFSENPRCALQYQFP